MHIDLFWVVLAVALYVALMTFVFLAQRRLSRLNSALVDALHKKAEASNFLSLFAKNLTGTDALSEAMPRTARYVAELVGAKALCIFTMDENGYLVAAGVSGAFPPSNCVSHHVLTKPVYLTSALKSEKIKVGDGVVGEVALTGEGVLLEDASEDERLANSPILIETLMAVPMKNAGRIVGVICAINNTHGNISFSLEQFGVLKFMSEQVVLANNIVEVYSNMSKQQRISQELDFAKQIQTSLIPKHAPAWAPFDIYASTTSAKEVSGDFFDFLKIDEDRLLVVVGDSCGKGIPACMLMATARSFIKASAERFSTLREMITGLNNDLFHDTGDERFVTVAFCLLDRSRRTVEYARAGHTELLVKRLGHPIRSIFPDGAALGLLPPEVVGNFDILSFSFLDDMTLLLFSDGITEALNSKNEEFGLDALVEVFLKSSESNAKPSEIALAVRTAVEDFAQGEPQADDQTIAVISHI